MRNMIDADRVRTSFSSAAPRFHLDPVVGRPPLPPPLPHRVDGELHSRGLEIGALDLTRDGFTRIVAIVIDACLTYDAN